MSGTTIPATGFAAMATRIGSDGYEATRRIRTNPDLRSVPIIAVTSCALAGDEDKALAAGCDGYVSKPYSPRDLLAKVRTYLG
jgi:two-component system cell cycle response regulator DivK